MNAGYSDAYRVVIQGGVTLVGRMDSRTKDECAAAVVTLALQQGD